MDKIDKTSPSLTRPASALAQIPANAKLVAVMLVFMAIAIISMGLTYMALEIQAAMRAYITGEGLWSKAQQDAVLQLERYAETGDPEYLEQFHRFLAVPLGNQQARLELVKPNYDYERVFAGLQQGMNHPKDIPGMIYLFRYFSGIPYLAQSTAIWAATDERIMQLQELAAELQRAHANPAVPTLVIDDLRAQIRVVDAAIRTLEENFSHTLSEAARWLKQTLLKLIVAVLVVLAILGGYVYWRILSNLQRLESIRSLADEDVRLAGNILAHIAEGVVVADTSLRIITINQAYTDITGFAFAEIMGKTLSYPVLEKQDETFFKALWAQVRASGQWQGELWDRRKTGEIYPILLTVSAIRNDAGRHSYYVGVFNDITQYKDYERRLAHLAYHDDLTKLPNRRGFEEQYRQIMARAQRRKTALGLLYIDLDGFKAVNDSYGHAIGDELLQTAAQRMQACLRQSDTIARMGGDEFIIVMEDIQSQEQPALLARRLLDALTQPFHCAAGQVYISASIGISCYPEDSTSPERMLSNADAAMYEAKQRGRNTYLYYSPAMNELASQKLELTNALRQALLRKELFLQYQPIVALQSGELYALEALLRWRHPKFGSVPAERFITLVEEIGLMTAFSEWSLRTVCKHINAWRKAGIDPPPIGFNLSPQQFRLPGFQKKLLDLLAEKHCDPEQFVLELTESNTIRDSDRIKQMMAELSQAGFTIALDDFGTGYSSLTALKQFTVDYLKIDRSFVAGLPDDPSDIAIVRTIIATARSFRLQVIAEGIETAAQRDFLLSEGCLYGQGFYFSRPLSLADVGALLRCRTNVGALAQRERR